MIQIMAVARCRQKVAHATWAETAFNIELAGIATPDGDGCEVDLSSSRLRSAGEPADAIDCVNLVRFFNWRMGCIPGRGRATPEQFEPL